MSYGWLTEQTILPQAPKKIVVHNQSSLIGLKSILLSKKEEHPTNNTLAAPKKHQPKRNKGVEEREKKDAMRQVSSGRTSEAKQVYSALRLKEKLYAEMNDRGSGLKETLVDFSSKKIENDDDYKELRKKFYTGKLNELQAEQGGELMAEQERDRVNWQKKMLDELANGQKAERTVVQQSYDKGMTAEELLALKEVLQEKEKEEERLQSLKRKGRELTEDRIRKLRKMNIIKEAKQR